MCKFALYSLQTANSSGGIVARNAHPASVIVFDCITNNGKSSLVFVDAVVKINQNNYFNNILIKEILP